MHSKSQKIIMIGLISLIFLIWFLQLEVVKKCTSEDAFIAFRYARNFSRGWGIVWNQGETPRTEGYTCFLWVLLLGTLSRMGFPLINSAKWMGVIFSSLTLILVLKMEFKQRKETIPFAGFFLVLNAGFAIYSVSGMETAFFTFLFIGGIYYFLRYYSSGRKLFSMFAFFLWGLATLTRPEGIFPVIATLILLVGEKIIFRFRSRHPAPLNLKALLPGLIIYLLLAGGYLIWRFLYYGHWLPNPSFFRFEVNLSPNFGYLFNYLRNFGGIMGVGILLFLSSLSSWNFNRRFIFLIFLLYASYVCFFTQEWMPLGRYYMPITPLFCLFLGEGIFSLLATGLFPRKVVSGVFMMAIFFILILVSFRNYRTNLDFINMGGSMRDLHRLGKWVHNNSSQNDILALSEAGVLAYYSDIKILDYYGLNDNHIAHLTPRWYKFPVPLRGGKRMFLLKADPDYVFQQKPRYIEFWGKYNPETGDCYTVKPQQMLISSHPDFKRYYRPVFPKQTEGIMLFQRIKESGLPGK